MTLSFDPNSVSFPCSHFIAGQFMPAEAASDFTRLSDETLFAGFPIGNADVVDRAVIAAKRALEVSAWARSRAREPTPRTWALPRSHRAQ